MSINTMRGPKGGSDAIASQLGHLMTRGPRATAPVGGAVESRPSTRDPLPLYRVPLEDLTDEGFLEHATEIGWRYLIFDNGPAALADVRLGPDKIPTLCQLTRGLIVERLAGAMRYAQQTYGEVHDPYEPRMLDIPELDTTAFWLHGRREVLMPLIEGTKALPMKWEDPEFVGRLLRKAKSRLERGADENAMATR